MQFSSITVIFKDKSTIIYAFFEQLIRDSIAYEMRIAFMSLCLPAPWDASCSMANQEQLSVILAGEKSGSPACGIVLSLDGLIHSSVCRDH